MNPTERRVVVVLVAMLVLTIGLILWGVGKQDDEPSGKTNQERAQNFKPPALLRAMGSPLDALRPKLKLDQREFLVSAPSRLVVIDVPAQPDASGQRIGRFHLTVGSGATIAYQDTTPDIDASLKHQIVSLPKADSDAGDDRNTASVIAMRNGGQLSLACTSGNFCVFKLD